MLLRILGYIKKSANAKAFILSALIAFFIVFLWFMKLGAGEFFYLHDQALYFSKDEILRSFFIRSDVNLGVAYGVNYVMTFFHRILYLVLFSLGFSIVLAEKVSFFLYILFTIFFSFVGFRKILDFVKKGSHDFWLTYLIAFYYAFNTYTLIMWHTGNFSTAFMLTYSLLPLTISYFFKLTKNELTVTELATLSILVFFSSFYMPLFAVDLMLISIILIYGFFSNFKHLKFYWRNLIKLFVFSLPLNTFLFVTVFYEFYNIQGAINANLDATYLMVSAGILGSLLQQFSWAIYTPWEDRIIFAFSNFFQNPLVILSYLLSYLVILIMLIKEKALNSFIKIGLVFLVSSLFFAKAASAPFGWIYISFFNTIPFFKVLRTPDSKMGMGVVFSTAVLFLLLMANKKKQFMYMLVLVLALLQSYPLITGEAILGRNASLGLDRAVSIPDEYIKISSVLQSDGSQNKTTLVVPPISFGKFDIGELHHLGQDMFPGVSTINPVYLDSTSGIYKDVFERIQYSLKNQDISILRDLGINYILVRSDVYNPSIKIIDEALFKPSADLIYADSYFKLFKFNPEAQLIQSDAASVQYKKISPVEYVITVSEVEEDRYTLKFLNSPHPGWRLFPRSGESGTGFLHLKYLLTQSVGNNLTTSGTMSNAWDVNSSNTEITLYFLPQVYTYAALTVTLITLLVYLSFILAKAAVLSRK